MEIPSKRTKSGVRRIPKKYVPESLTPAQKRKQIKSIVEETDRPKLDIKTRRSKWTVMAEKYFGDNIGSTRIVFKLAPNSEKRRKELLKGIGEILSKGKGAYYSSGSRPNQSANSWATARLYSVLFGGPAREVDEDIVKKYNIPLLKIPKKSDK